MDISTQPTGPAHECHCVLHEPPASLADWSAADHRMVGDIAASGWQVLRTDDATAGPGWAFTVGLWHSYGLPELTMSGPVDVDLDGWLDTAARLARRRLTTLRPDAPITGVVDGVELRAKAVHPAWYAPLFGAMTWFAQQPPLPMLQLVWPDADRRYPWDLDAGVTDHTDQAQLWLAPEAHPEGVWRRRAFGSFGD